MKNPFSCTQGDSKFANPAELKIQKNHHTMKNPFSCTQCDSKFANSAELKMPKNHHHNEKPIQLHSSRLQIFKPC